MKIQRSGMKKLIIGGLAALAIGLAGAPVAGAVPNYSQADMDFIAGVDFVLATSMTRTP